MCGWCRRLSSVSDNMDRFGFTMCDATSDDIITEQKGVFRTNCLDWYYYIPCPLGTTKTDMSDNNSLDRTNFVQDILSRTSLEQYLLLVRREWVSSNSLWSYHRELWAENGDALSRIYAGTGALNTSFTRSGKRTFAGMTTPCLRRGMVVDQSSQAFCQMQPKAFQGHISTTSRTRESRSLLTCFWYIHTFSESVLSLIYK